MSEVERYTPSMRVGRMVKDKDGLWNRSQDFDRVTAERDALQQLLTAADERADALAGHYFELKEAVQQLLSDAIDADCAGEMVVQRADIDELRPLIAALKPAEGGGDAVGRMSLSDKALSLIDEEIRIKGLPS